MRREDVEKFIGHKVTLNGLGDLGMDPNYRKLIQEGTQFEIEKLTKGGMVVLTHSDIGEFNKKHGIHALTIAPKNLDLVNNMKIENICLFDLDGTLADFDSAMKEAIEKMRSPDEPVINPWDRSKSWIRARKESVMKQVGYWKNLPKFQLGFDVLKIAEELEYEIHVLTKGPSSSAHAWTEKVEWCHENLPENVKITLSQDKGLVYGKVLVDDWPEYINRWLEWRPRGLVIMPAHPHNEGFIHKNVIRYDGTNIGEVQEEMVKHMMRQPGESR